MKNAISQIGCAVFVFGAVALTLLVTALAASSFPAARAVRVDARTALQTE